MNLFIFRTDLQTNEKKKTLGKVFNRHPAISDWSVDMEDIDNVMRIQTSEQLTEYDIIKIVKKEGISCEILTY